VGTLLALSGTFAAAVAADAEFFVVVTVVSLAGVHQSEAVADADANPPAAEADVPLPELALSPGSGVAAAAEVCPAGVALPSVLPPPVGELPPLSTLSPAWINSCRNGCTPTEMPAMSAIPASAIAGRTQPMPARPSRRTVLDVEGTRYSRGNGSSARSRMDVGHAQCPRHVQ